MRNPTSALGISATLCFLHMVVFPLYSQQGCPALNPKTVGWAKGSTVTYAESSGFTSTELTAIRAGFTAWKNTPTALNISFTEINDPVSAMVVVQKGRVVDPSGTPRPAGVTLLTSSSTSPLSGAIITLNLSNVGQAQGAQPFYDSNQTNYALAVTKNTEDEIGHTMGLADEPFDPNARDANGNLLPCGGQTAGNSIMNGMCGTNDSSNNLPSSPTQCDKNTISSNPQITGGGGGGDGSSSDPDEITCTLTRTDQWRGGTYTDSYGESCNDDNETDYYSCSDGTTYEDTYYLDTVCSGDGSSCSQDQINYCHENGTDINPDCMCGDTPVVVNVFGRGLRFSSPLDGVPFDMSGIGTRTRYSWPLASSGSALLVLDRNGNGLIDNGSELFGNRTPQPPSDQRNGFVALSEFDKPENGGNSDGVIDARDAVFTKLRVWLDINQNGVSEQNELFSLQRFGIESIELSYKLDKRRDRYGNVLRFRSRISGHDPTTGASFERNAYDVILKTASASARLNAIRDLTQQGPPDELREFSRRVSHLQDPRTFCGESRMRITAPNAVIAPAGISTKGASR